MVSLRGVWLTLKTVENPWNVALIYLDGKPRLVKFKNAFSEVIKNRFDFLTLRRLVLDGWKISKFDDEYLFSKDELKITAPLKKCNILFNILNEPYKVFDFRDKVCLDVGGFIGETAVLFKMWGAKKVIIYEPVAENCKYIERNTKLNNVNAEIHCIGISDCNGTLEVRYDDFSVDFGLKGNKKIAIPVISASKALTKKIDIAKFDCEGCEQCLLSASRDVLRLVPNYIIEYHHNLCRKLVEKFIKSGFSVKMLTNPQDPVGMFMASRD